MSGKNVKRIRRTIRKNKNKIQMNFLDAIYYEPFKIRFKLAMKILFNIKPKGKK
jgi:hypothetical protein